MGMYTELIFGARLKESTPKTVIDVLKYMIGDANEKPENFPFSEGRAESVLSGGSYYFGVSNAATKMWFDENSSSWHISSRSNIKNYGNEIETFLSWIKPFIDSGSGSREFYAIVIYEEQEVPTIYYLHESSALN